MDEKKLSGYLMSATAIVAACLAIAVIAVVPAAGEAILYDYPEFSGWYMPWLAFIWLAAIPCFVALALVWKIAQAIRAGQAFTSGVAHLLAVIAKLAAGDALFFLAGNIALFCKGMNHPGVLLLSLLVVCAGIAGAAIASALSHLVERAAELQEESDLTI